MTAPDAVMLSVNSPLSIISIFLFGTTIYIQAVCEHLEDRGDIFKYQQRTDLKA